MSRTRIAGIIALLMPLVWGPAASADVNFPTGYEVGAHENLAPGVEHFTFFASDPAEVVHVARLTQDSPFTLRSVLSNDAVAGSPRLERTSSMCIRIACVAAVNGDFHDPRSGQPIGAVVGLGQLLRSPRADHVQLLVDHRGGIRTGPLAWRGELVSIDLRRIGIEGVNVPRGPDGVVLYTWANGSGTPAGGTDLIVRPVKPEGPIRLDQTFVLRLEAHRPGGGSVPAGAAVLSGAGAGAGALDDLWRRANDGTASRDVLMRLETEPGAAESIGGSPVLVVDGRPTIPTARTSFVNGRHPRTLVGRTADGDTLLVTVDGRQSGYSEGMTLAEAADLMIRLGAVEAINLDGGGSTTFVANGTVVNRTSDRLVRRGGQERLVALARPAEPVLGHVERPVSVSLAIVPEGAEPAPPTAPAPTDLELPEALPLQASPHDVDPASDPFGSVPALSLPPDVGNLATIENVPGGQTAFGEVTRPPEPRPVPLTGAILGLAAALAVLGERRIGGLAVEAQALARGGLGRIGSWLAARRR